MSKSYNHETRTKNKIRIQQETELDLVKEEDELINSIQSLIASALCESSRDNETGFGVPEEDDTFVEPRFLGATKQKTATIHSPTFLKYFTGDIILHVPVIFVPLLTRLLGFSLQDIVRTYMCV